MPEPDIQQSYNRDDQLKPGSPNRMAQEPKGSEGSARNSKTQTDPASGEPLPGAPAPNQAESDERDPPR